MPTNPNTDESRPQRSPWSRPRLERLEMAQTAGATTPGVGEGDMGNYT